jgi:opacity protein-like surface antigen
MLAAVAFVAVLALPARAHAQGYVAGFLSYDVGGDAGSCPSLVHDCSEKKSGYGVTLGFLMGHLIGFEEDLGFAPDFYGKSTSFGSNSVLTAMSNIVVSVPLPIVRPYASAGVGLMRSHVGFGAGSIGTADVNDNSLGYNIGGGVMLSLIPHIGLRGDVREMHSLQDVTIAGVAIPGSKLNFTRVSIGLLLH